jgi:hypothetical protein
MRFADMVEGENNEHTGQTMMPGTTDRGIVGICAVDTAIGQNLGDELDHVCELRKGICDVLTLVQMNGVNGEYLKVIFELFAQSRGRIQQIEVAKALTWNSSTLLRRWRRLGLIAPFSMTGKRQQEVSLIVQADEEAVPLPRPLSAAVQIDEECGGDGEEAPGQTEADSRLVDLAGRLECSADRETVLADVRILAHQAVQLAPGSNRGRT